MERGERDKERAAKVAEQVRRAAALTAELAAQSEKEVSEVCSHPPGLHDEEAAVTPQPTCSPSLVTSNSFQTSQGFLSFSGKFRDRQPRSDTRAQEKAALVDETLSLLAKVTGKDEASMRPRFQGMKLEDLRKRARPLEETRGRETTAPRKEGRSVGAVQKTTEIRSGAKRGVRARVQAEGTDENALTVRSWSP